MKIIKFLLILFICGVFVKCQVIEGEMSDIENKMKINEKVQVDNVGNQVKINENLQQVVENKPYEMKINENVKLEEKKMVEFNLTEALYLNEKKEFSTLKEYCLKYPNKGYALSLLGNLYKVNFFQISSNF